MALNTRQLLVWVAALATMAVTTSAGVWQMGRARQKEAAEAALLTQRSLPAWRNADWPCGGARPGANAAGNAAGDAAADAASLPVQRPVVLRGHWLAGHTIFLDNRPMDKATGFIVVTPLRLWPDDPACPGKIVLVQRGWVPRNAQDRLRLPDVATPAGPVVVSGRVAGSLSQVYQLGLEPPPSGASAPLVRQNADAAFWATWLGVAPSAGAVLQSQAAQPVDAQVLRRQWPEPGQGRDKHLAYAAQWFAMAAVVAGLTIWFQLIRPRRR